MNLIIADTDYKLGEFLAAMNLDITQGPTIKVGQHNVYTFIMFSMYCTVKGFDYDRQISAIRLHFQEIENVIFINKGLKFPMGPPWMYFPKSVEEFIDSTGLDDLSTSVRQKLQERVFQEHKRARVRPPAPMRIAMSQNFAAIPKANTWKQRLKPAEEGTGCVACTEKKATVLLVPCEHQCLCDDCAEKWVLQKGKCPLCAEPVNDVWRPRVNV